MKSNNNSSNNNSSSSNFRWNVYRSVVTVSVNYVKGNKMSSFDIQNVGGYVLGCELKGVTFDTVNVRDLNRFTQPAFYELLREAVCLQQERGSYSLNSGSGKRFFCWKYDEVTIEAKIQYFVVDMKLRDVLEMRFPDALFFSYLKERWDRVMVDGDGAARAETKNGVFYKGRLVSDPTYSFILSVGPTVYEQLDKLGEINNDNGVFVGSWEKMGNCKIRFNLNGGVLTNVKESDGFFLLGVRGGMMKQLNKTVATQCREDGWDVSAWEFRALIQ